MTDLLDRKYRQLLTNVATARRNVPPARHTHSVPQANDIVMAASTMARGARQPGVCRLPPE